MNSISTFRTVEVGYPFRLRGAGNTQNDTGVLFQPPSVVSNQAGGTPTRGTARFPGMSIGFYELHNRSGSTGVLGLGVRLPNNLWIAGQWVDAAGTPFTADTADAQSETAGDFVLETLTNNDGYVVASPVPFNAWSIDVATASVGAGAVRAVRYTNAAGDGWTALTNPFILDGASGVLAATGTTHANEGLVVVAPPVEWGRTATGGLSGIPEGLYAMNVRATTAPATTAAIADSISLYRLYFLTEAVADNASDAQDFGAKDFVMAEDWHTTRDAIYYGDALVALFETANPQNRVTVQVRSIG